MRILFLSGWYPYPPNNGSKLRIYNLIRGLAERHDVSLVTFTDGGEADMPSPELRAMCFSIAAIPKPAYRPGSARAIAGLLSTRPRSIVDTRSPEFAAAIRQAAVTSRASVVVASEWATAAYQGVFGDMPAVFEDLEIGAFESTRDGARGRVRRLRYDLTLLKLRRYLQHLLPGFSACTVVSRAEAELLRRYVPAYDSVEVVPNCVDVGGYADVAPEPAPMGLIFTGSFRYSANYDAARWFVSEVYPLIQAQAPDVTLSITGDHAGLPLPPASGVRLTGFVDDVRPLVAGAAVSVVPIRSGGGTRLKILEAMTLRTPVVSTSKGAEGLEAEHGRHLLIADTPREFANAVALLLGDRRLAAHLTTNAYELVSEKYNWDRTMPRFLQLVERVAAR